MSIIVNTKPARKAPQFMSHAGDLAGSGVGWSWTHNIEPQAKAIVIALLGSWYWSLYGYGASVAGVSATQAAVASYNFTGLNYGLFSICFLFTSCSIPRLGLKPVALQSVPPVTMGHVREYRSPTIRSQPLALPVVPLEPKAFLFQAETTSRCSTPS